MTDNKKKIYTIGYSGRTLTEVVNIVNELGATLVDIRLNPQSRRPEFNQDQLKAALGERYIHLPQLGNLNYNNGRAIEIANLRAGLATLSRLSTPAMLMCACRDYNACHRRVVAQAAVEYGFTVEEYTGHSEDTIKVLSIRWPWAGFILYGDKRVENRTRFPEAFRGKMYIHVPQKMDDEWLPRWQQSLLDKLPPFEKVRGKIIGHVDVVNVLPEVDDPWYVKGNKAIILDNPTLLPKFIPYRGQLGLFNAPASVVMPKDGENGR